MRSFLLGLLLCTGVAYTAQSQRVCGTTEYTKQLLQSDPSFAAGSKKAIQQITATLSHKTTGNTARRDTASNEIIYIPIVVHVLYKTATENISDAQIKSQIDALNKDFRRLNADRVNTPQAFKSLAADTRIQFCLAQVDPQGKRTTGIDRKYTNRNFFTTDDAMKFAASGGADSWNSKQYLNIWVVKLSGRTLAYATPPGAAADRDGLVIAYDVFGTIEKVRSVFDKGRTATHEIGHWLGLIHTWGDTSCGDDQVDDTPKQQSYNFGCPTFPKLSTCSPDGNGDMFMNYMDFSDDACMNMFTWGQAKRMRALFAQGNLRNSFLSSFACDSNLVQAGPVADTLPLTVTPPVVDLADTKVFPNPVSSVVTVESKLIGNHSIVNMRILNAVGVEVYNTRLNLLKTTHDLAKLKSGVYIIQVTAGNNVFTTKIIKL